MKIGFASVDSRKEIQAAVDFLAKQSLGYPRYNEWIGRAEAELHSGYKRGILGFLEDRLVADIIWQPHKALQGVAEIKNLRIAPAVRSRLFGKFLLRQVETTCGFPVIMCDARTDQKSTIQFMVNCGYTPTATVALYDSDCLDTVLVKWIQTDDFRTARFSMPSVSPSVAT